MPRHHRLSPEAPVFQPSAIKLFRSPVLGCGTVCRRILRRRCHWLFLGKVWKPISSKYLQSFLPQSRVMSAQSPHFGFVTTTTFIKIVVITSFGYCPPSWILGKIYWRAWTKAAYMPCQGRRTHRSWGVISPHFFYTERVRGTKIDDNNTRLQACNVFSSLSQIKRF